MGNKFSINQKMWVEDIENVSLLRVTDTARATMNGPSSIEVGDLVKVLTSPSDMYQVLAVFPDGTYSIVLKASVQRGVVIQGVEEHQLRKLETNVHRLYPRQKRFQKFQAPTLKWVPEIAACVRRTGTVRKIDTMNKDNVLALLEFYDPETLSVNRWWFPFHYYSCPFFATAEWRDLMQYLRHASM